MNVIDNYIKLIKTCIDPSMNDPVQWINVILAMYSQKSKASKYDVDWLNDSYWNRKFLSKADISHGYPADEQEIDMYADSSMSAKKIRTLTCLDVFEFATRQPIVNNGNKWYKIKFDGKDGYVLKSKVMEVLNPACCQIKGATDLPYLRAAAMLDIKTSSYKVFNRLHFYSGDADITLGFQHLAGNNVTDFFQELKNNTERYTEFCQYLVYRLYRSANEKYYYKWQAANDSIFHKSLFPELPENDEVTPEMLSTLTSEQWLTAVKEFFSTNGVLGIPEQMAEIRGGNRMGVSIWAENQMLQQKGKYGLVWDKANQKFQKKTYATGKKNEMEFAQLFQNGEDDPDTTLTGFWFHDIVKDALLLKSMAEMQVDYWKENYYKFATDKASDNGLSKCFGAILSIVSWKNTVYPSFRFTDKLKSGGTLELLVTVKKKNGEIQITIELTRNQIFGENSNMDQEKLNHAKEFLIWLAYTKYRRKTGHDISNPRGRMRAIWNVYLSKNWELKKDIKYPTEVSHIIKHK